MSAFQLVRDGATVAVELIALLFTAPQTAGAGETQKLVTPVVQAQPRANETADAQQLHALHSALEVHLLGTLADIRVTQTVRNGTADTVNLATYLPLDDERTERLAFSRDGRTVDLLGANDGGCGGGDEGPGDGQLQATIDEMLADLLQLPPGGDTTITVETIDTLERYAGAYRFALPPTAVPMPAQSLLLVQPEGGIALVLIPPHDSDGHAVLTLRPASGETARIELGRISGRSAAFVVPLDIEPEALLAGSVELEVVNSNQVTWTTVPATPAITNAASGNRVLAHGAAR